MPNPPAEDRCVEFKYLIFNRYLYQSMVKNLFLTCLFIISLAVGKQLVIKYQGIPKQMQILKSHFYRIKYGYFIDLGGYNPIQYSTTIRLSNWKGIIIQANQKRLGFLRDFQRETTPLNLAVTNVSGEIITFYNAPEAEGQSSLSINGLGGKSYKEQRVMSISLADLCHTYYKKKPNFMNIDLQGMGEMILRSNDWTNDKCVPEIIYAEDFDNNIQAGLPNIEKFLTEQGYVMIDRNVLNKIFIHSSKVQFYKKQAEANKAQLKFDTMTVIQWPDITRDLSTLLGRPLNHAFNARSEPAFIHTRQPSIINIEEINQYSNLVSQVGANRPIIVFEFDQSISSIYLGTNNFKIQRITLNPNVNLQKINAVYEGFNLTVYILDHKKYDQLKVNFLPMVQNQKKDQEQSQTEQQDQEQQEQIENQVYTQVQKELSYIEQKFIVKSKDLKQSILITIMATFLLSFIVLAISSYCFKKRSANYKKIFSVNDERAEK